MKQNSTPLGDQSITALRRTINRDRKAFKRKDRLHTLAAPGRVHTFTRYMSAAEIDLYAPEMGHPPAHVTVIAMEGQLVALAGPAPGLGWSSLPVNAVALFLANIPQLWSDVRPEGDPGVMAMEEIDHAGRQADLITASPALAAMQTTLNDIVARKGASK